ncbi:methyltransferase [Planococcaceae bacterium Storch 2/2-2]|nr:methyltransferase [Planococcaceae bacterium Storch 2/2-2]
MDKWLKDDERLDYLLAEQLRIIQSPSVFSFSLDAVVLARFATIPKRETGRIVDLCTGNGAIPLFLSARTKADIIGVELQPKLADMAKRSVAYNQLTEQIDIQEGNVIGAAERLGYDRYDAVTCNPPYFQKHERSIRNPNEHLAIARHEIELTLEQAIESASALLKQGGRAAFVHRPERLTDLLTLLRTHRLEPKRLQFVYPKEGAEANAVLVDAKKDGKPGVIVERPIYTFDSEGNYTPDVRKLLYGDE